MSPTSEKHFALLQEIGLLQSSKGKPRELLKTIADCVGKFSEWRNQELGMLLCRHLKHTANGACGALKHPRFSLTTYLLENRVPPDVVVEWYLLRGMLKDRFARDGVRSIIEAWWHGRLSRHRAYHLPWRITTPSHDEEVTMFARWLEDSAPKPAAKGNTVDDCRCVVKCKLQRCKFGDWNEHYFPIAGPSKSVQEHEIERYAYALWLLSSTLKASLGRFIMAPEMVVKDAMIHEDGSDDDEVVLHCDQHDGNGLRKYEGPLRVRPKTSTPITVGKRFA